MNTYNKRCVRRYLYVIIVFISPLVNNYPSMEHGDLKCLSFYLFTGVAGYVNIDTNGDRIADYSLLDMDPATYTFHVSVTVTYTQLSSLRVPYETLSSNGTIFVDPLSLQNLKEEQRYVGRSSSKVS